MLTMEVNFEEGSSPRTTESNLASPPPSKKVALGNVLEQMKTFFIMLSRFETC